MVSQMHHNMNTQERGLECGLQLMKSHSPQVHQWAQRELWDLSGQYTACVKLPIKLVLRAAAPGDNVIPINVRDLWILFYLMTPWRSSRENNEKMTSLITNSQVVRSVRPNPCERSALIRSIQSFIFTPLLHRRCSPWFLDVNRWGMKECWRTVLWPVILCLYCMSSWSSSNDANRKHSL